MTAHYIIYMEAREMTQTQHSIEIGIATETTTGVEHGIDVVVSVDGVDGEVTLLPAEDGVGGYGSWGSPDHWVSGDLLVYIRTLDDAETVLRDLADQAGAEADAVAL